MPRPPVVPGTLPWKRKPNVVSRPVEVRVGRVGTSWIFRSGEEGGGVERLRRGEGVELVSYRHLLPPLRLSCPFPPHALTHHYHRPNLLQIHPIYLPPSLSLVL